MTLTDLIEAITRHQIKLFQTADGGIRYEGPATVPQSVYDAVADHQASLLPIAKPHPASQAIAAANNSSHEPSPIAKASPDAAFKLTVESRQKNKAQAEPNSEIEAVTKAEADFSETILEKIDAFAEFCRTEHQWIHTQPYRTHFDETLAEAIGTGCIETIDRTIATLKTQLVGRLVRGPSSRFLAIARGRIQPLTRDGPAPADDIPF